MLTLPRIAKRGSTVALLPGQMAAGALVFVAIGCAGAPRRVPPRQPPARQVPEVELPAAAPEPGHGRVVFHVPDGPMRVTVRQERTVEVSTKGEEIISGYVCTTPCVADLPQGAYSLYLGPVKGRTSPGGDKDDLVVRSGTWVYLRAPGYLESPDDMKMYTAVVLLSVSTSLIVPGLFLAGSGEGGLQAAGVGMVGGGVAGGVASGIWAYHSSRGEIQEGATTYFQLSKPAPRGPEKANDPPAATQETAKPQPADG